MATPSSKPQRFGQIVRLKEKNLAEYTRLHDNIWPEILQLIRDANIRNYTIFFKDDTLYAYFEYAGSDIEGDWKKMVDSAKMKEWWAICCPLQEPVPTRAPGEWWANMKEVWHMD